MEKQIHVGDGGGSEGLKRRGKAGSVPGVIRPPREAGFHGFHPKVPLNLSKPWCKEVAELIEEVHQCGLWRQQACTTTRFLS